MPMRLGSESPLMFDVVPFCANDLRFRTETAVDAPKESPADTYEIEVLSLFTLPFLMPARPYLILQ